MVEEGKESPQLAKPEVKKVDKSEDEIKSLLDTLEKVGVKTPQHLEGIAQNAKEYGYVTNLLGQERQRVTDLETKLRDLETRSYQKPAPMDYSQAESQPVDLERFIKKAIRDEREDERRNLAEMHKRQLQSWNTIQSDPDYGNVRDIWEDRLKDPNFVYRINAGMTDPVREYGETVRQFYKGLAMKAKETIETIRTEKIKPPHMETGERGGNIVSEGEGERHPLTKRFEELKSKVKKGGNLSSEEELELARYATYGMFPSSPRS
jgi:hypothetical protein